MSSLTQQDATENLENEKLDLGNKVWLQKWQIQLKVWETKVKRSTESTMKIGNKKTENQNLTGLMQQF